MHVDFCITLLRYSNVYLVLHLEEETTPMATALPGELSDEEWLVSRARSCFKSDPWSAKAWMLTARTLFPTSFNIQVDPYWALDKVLYPFFFHLSTSDCSNVLSC